MLVGPPPKTGLFLATRRVVVNFFWASGWFLIVFLSLLAFEHSRYDPTHIAVSTEPDGAHGISWWRQTVAHTMLSSMRRASEETAAATANQLGDIQNAAAAQSTLVLRELTGRRGRSSNSGGGILDSLFTRKIWHPIVVPHIPALVPLHRMLGYFLNFQDPVEGMDGGFYSRRGTYNGRFIDPRMPAQCGTMLFIDGASGMLGSEQGGAFVATNSLEQQQQQVQQQQQLNRALFESFLYCGNKRDSPSEIGRRLDEYFRSCVPEPKSAAADNNNNNNNNNKPVSCVAPGILALLLLNRRIQSTHPTMQHTRTVFLDIGSGSELLSSIAVSALHGYRQSSRLARTRRFAQRDEQARQQQQRGMQPERREFNNPSFAEAVIAPPAVVVPVEMSFDFASPLESTRVCTAVASNAKLFSSGNVRADCFGQDPDRVPTMPINAAVGRQHEDKADEPSTFFVMKTFRSNRAPLASNAAAAATESATTDLLQTPPRVFQCFIKEERVPPTFVGKSKVAQDEKAGNDVRKQLLIQYEEKNSDSAAAVVLSVLSPEQLRARLARLPSSIEWEDIVDREWGSRLAPHLEHTKLPLEVGKTVAEAFPASRSQQADEHTAKMHPTSVRTVIGQATRVAKGFKEEEFTNGRAVQDSTVVAFADVAGHDDGAGGFLDYGLAVSQTEIVESMADALLELPAQLDGVGGAPSGIPSLEAVIVLRPIAIDTERDKNHRGPAAGVHGEFGGWCHSASDSAAVKLADRTAAALERAGAMIIAGCGSGEATSSFSFLPITRGGGSALMLLRSYLLQAGDHDALSESASPFCAVWMSRLISDPNSMNNKPVSSSSLIPSVEELRELRMSVLERRDDDAKAGLTTTERAAVAMGLAVASEEEDEGTSNSGGGDSSSSQNAAHVESGSSGGGSGIFSPLSLGLLTVALLTAFFLIRGVLKNFKRTGGGGVSGKEK